MFLFKTLVSLAQGEANIWYFGQNAGLDFNSGSPVALTNGQLNTDEGCATLSTPEGQLLFYTDGITVYNRNHNIMPNGFGLMGHPSSAQSATIVQKPGSTNLYYVFTTDNEHDPNGFRYSIIDLDQDGGFGAVTSEKNILVYTPTIENLGVTKHANGTDIWIVTHGWDSTNFNTYLLTDVGLSATPVVSSIGLPVTGNGFTAAGTIKLSPSGSKLAITSVSDFLQLFDFNISTGVLTNEQTLLIETGELYGVAFSPDENLLYVSNSIGKLYQFDLQATDISNSKITLRNNSNPTSGALQLGPDGKIYIAFRNRTKIGVINNPNQLGVTCDLQFEAIDLNGRICKAGLPSFNQSFFNASFSVSNFCIGTATEFNLNSSTPVTSAIWNFGDGSPTVNAVAPSHTYANDGNYTVTVTATSVNGTVTRSKSITISAVPVIANTISNKTVCGSANMNYDLSQFTTPLLGS